jgi:16S rRNA (uracil1498-N3)-methyltransferase
VLSLATGTEPLQLRLQALATTGSGACFLIGPEGGLSPGEEAQALQAGFAPTGLGPRVLRTETAAIAVVAAAALLSI